MREYKEIIKLQYLFDSAHQKPYQIKVSQTQKQIFKEHKNYIKIDFL